jgi:hypothetical protein
LVEHLALGDGTTTETKAMDDLFRFMTARGPQAAKADATIPLTGSQGTTPFQDGLRPLRGTPGAFEAMAEKARQYEAGPELADPIAALNFGSKLASFYRTLQQLAVGEADHIAALIQQGVNHEDIETSLLSDLDGDIDEIFDFEADDLVENEGFANTRDRVHDSLIALFLAPATGRLPPSPEAPTPPLARAIPIGPLADLARVIDIIVRVANDDATLNKLGALGEAVRRTLLLPPTIFPLLPEPRIRPVGIADLLVVRQHLTRYERDEVREIQNMLIGESRTRTAKHTLTIEQTVITETEKTTETSKELKTAERFAMRSEVEKTLKEDTSVNAGLSISAKFGKTVTLDTNVGVAYSTSKESARKTSTNFAKEVTTRAASKVTERIRTQEISKTVETFLDQEDHGFDNTYSFGNVRGVYQWLNKVYTAQVFNYGKRLLFDISVPEPAAFLLSTGNVAAEARRPVPPIPFTLDGRVGGAPLRPTHLSPLPDLANAYLKIAARYGVESVEPPPPAEIRLTKALSASDGSADSMSNLLIDSLDTMKIPEGYAAGTLRVHGTYTQKNRFNSDEQAQLVVGSTIVLYVGSVAFWFQQGTFEGDPHKELKDATFTGNTVDLQQQSFPAEIDRIALALSTSNVQGLSLGIELTCEATSAVLEGWRLRVYSTILQAYQQQLSDYEDRLAGLVGLGQSTTDAAIAFGGSPDRNRIIERRELKKSAIEILAGKNLVDLDRRAVVATPPRGQTRNFPRLDLSKVGPEGAFARFLEQAFEWEEMTYFFYPYFWSRLSVWYDKALMTHDDPLFLEFLKAGAARVVVPVRPGFEADVQYYLMTGQVWSGGELPGVADSDYLSIAQEIKETTGAPGSERPVGETWEVTVPTQLIKLREDGWVPAWKQNAPGDWSVWVDDYASFL